MMLVDFDELARMMAEVCCQYDTDSELALRCVAHCIGNNASPLTPVGRALVAFGDALESYITREAGRQPDATVIECKYLPFVVPVVE